MAERLIMAEAIGAHEAFTKLEDPLLRTHDQERIRTEAAREGGSAFSMARATYDHYCRINSRSLSPDLQAELQNRREGARRELIRFKDTLGVEPAALQKKDGGTVNVIVHDFREAVFKFYKKFKAAKSNEIYGGDKDTVLRQARHGADFEETMFDDSIDLKELEGIYGGLLRYMYAGVAQEMDKEQHGRDTENALNPLVRQEFEDIKTRRARERRRDRKYETRSTHYGVIYEFSAENARELPDAVLDYTKDQFFALLKNPPEDIDKEVRKIEEESGRYLEQNRIRLIEEGQDIPETHPEFVRAKALAKAIPIVLGYEQILYKGGEESAPAYKLKAAADYAGIEDAIYLENPKSALQMHLISTYKDGLYWLGQRWDTEKPESEDYIPGEGATNDLRKEIAEEIIGYAATHELFLSDEMTRGLYLDANGDPILGEDGLPIGAFTYREERNPDGRDLRYAFDDNIERLLLDPDGSVWADIERKFRERGEGQDEINQARERYNTRVAVFQRIKEKHDIREGLSFVTFQEIADLKRHNGGRFPTEQQLAVVARIKKDVMLGQLQSQGLSPAQAEVQLRQRMTEHRAEGIRTRIKDQMKKNTNLKYSAIAQLTRKAQLDLEDADAKEGSSGSLHDKILWGWVEDYNQYLIKIRQSRWYPSGWDRVRMNIDRPTKVLDRELSGDELMAMFELNPLTLKYPGQLSEEEKAEKDYKLDEARFGFQLARSYQVFHMVDTITGGMRTRLTDPNTGRYIGKLFGDDPETKEVNRRLGLTDANDNVINPNRKIARVFDIVQTRLQIAIEAEEQQINLAKAERDDASASGDQARIVEARRNLRDIILNSQFVATHVLKELGLVEGKLPVWSLNFLDSTTMYAFTEALADYGVEVGEFVGAEDESGVPITHNSKKEFYEIMERGRRALKSEYDRAAVEFMEGRFRTTDEQGRPAKAIYMAGSDFGIDEDPQTITERNRIVNIGGVRGNRRITETRFELSTSGGVIDYELVSIFGDLGFYPLPVWWGVTDIRSMHGYYKRSDEKEYHDHKYADVMDPVQHAKAQAAAYKARTALTGGPLEIAKATGGVTAGFLMEIFLKSTNIAEFIQKHSNQFEGRKMKNTAEYAAFLQRFRSGEFGDLSFTEFNQRLADQLFNKRQSKVTLDVLNQMTYLDYDKMNREMINDLYFKTYEVMTYLLYYIQAEKEVEQNRIGNAPRNWHYDNTVKWYAFRRLLREAIQKGEKGMVLRGKFSPEAGSEISLLMIQTVLEDADYLILKYYERERLAREGAQILSRALTTPEKQDGFVIPDEENWPNPNLVSADLRKALENIRRRGLLEFMREEGYTLYETDSRGRLVMLKKGEQGYEEGKDKPKPVGKSIIGNKVPVLVQQLQAEQNHSLKAQRIQTNIVDARVLSDLFKSALERA